MREKNNLTAGTGRGAGSAEYRAGENGTETVADKYAVFRHNLAVLRIRSGMTQEELAEAAGVSRVAVAKWETGRGMPKLENLIALRDVFRVPVDEMLFERLAAEPEKEEGKYETHN